MKKPLSEVERFRLSSAIDRQLAALIEVLPRDSLLRHNVLVIRDAHRAGPDEEKLLHELLAKYVEAALGRVETQARRKISR